MDNNTENGVKSKNIARRLRTDAYSGMLLAQDISRGGEVVSRLAHNQEIAGAIPAPATWRSAQNH